MGILGDRTGITRQTPVPTNDMTMSSNIDQITSQSTGTFIVASTGAADVGSAAGTIVLFGLDRAPIYNASGTSVGTNQDTSFSFDATDTFDDEIAFNYEKYYTHLGGGTQAVMAADMDATLLTNGQYMVNYETGLVIGRKKDADTTETVTYKTRALTVETTLSSAFDLTKIGGVSISAKNAAFAEPPLGVGYEYEALGSLTTDGGSVGDKVPYKGSAVGVPYVGLTDVAGTKEAVLLEGATHGSGDAGIMSLVIRNDALADLSGGDGNYAGLQVDANGAAYVQLGSSATSGPNAVLGTATYAEATTEGLIVGAVRNDALAALADTDNEVAPLQVDAGGALYVQLGDAADNSPIATDASAQDATPEVLNIGGEYRAADTTYTDGNATILQTDVNGYTKVRSKSYDSGTTADKVYEVSPINLQYDNAVINVDTTNVAAAATYYPSSTGFTMNGKKNFSLTGKFIDGDAVTTTLSIQGTNDEDTTNADWVNINGQINGLASATVAIPTVTGTVAGVTGVAVVPGTVCDLLTTAVAQTVKFAWDFDNLNYRHVRVVLTPGDATNTVILKGRISY